MSDPRYKAEFGVSRLIRYHGKRQTFFDGLHRLVLFTNAVLGSSAFVTVISGKTAVTAWLTAIVAVASSLDNVIGFSERARKYQEQRSRYFDLYCHIVSATDFNEAKVRESRLRIDRDSPPTRRVLDVISRNEEDIARGWKYADTRYIGPVRYMLRHILDIPPREWITVGERQSRQGRLWPFKRTNSGAPSSN